MSIVYTLLDWGSHFTHTQLAILACVGIATLSLGTALVVGWALDSALRALRARLAGSWRTMQDAAFLRNADSGSCDGLNAAQIAELIEVSWVLGGSEHR